MISGDVQRNQAWSDDAPDLDATEPTVTDGEPPPLPGPDWHKFHRGYEAAGRGDIEAVLAFLHPRIEWDLSHAFPDGPVYTGHAGVRRFFADAAKLWDDFRIEIEELQQRGEHVLVVGHWSGVGRGSGVPIRAPGTWVYRMWRGRATSMRFYRDRDAALGSLPDTASAAAV